MLDLETYLLRAAGLGRIYMKLNNRTETTLADDKTEMFETLRIRISAIHWNNGDWHFSNWSFHVPFLDIQ